MYKNEILVTDSNAPVCLFRNVLIYWKLAEAHPIRKWWLQSCTDVLTFVMPLPYKLSIQKYIPHDMLRLAPQYLMYSLVIHTPLSQEYIRMYSWIIRS